MKNQVSGADQGEMHLRKNHQEDPQLEVQQVQV
jgi:hypothetical protein